MRKKKKIKQEEQRLWVNFCFYARIAPDVEAVPAHIPHLRCRDANIRDEDICKMVQFFRSVDLFDLDDNELTNASVQCLSTLQYVKELRLKNCGQINADCLEDICHIKGLELLHLGGTAVGLCDLEMLRSMQELKTILVSSEEDTERIKEHLLHLSILMPDCEIIVNHRPSSFYLNG